MSCVISPFHCHWYRDALYWWCVSGSHRCHGTCPQDDTDTRSWLNSATAQYTEDTCSYLGPAVQKMILPCTHPLCHQNNHTLFSTSSFHCIHLSVTKKRKGVLLRDFKLGTLDAESISAVALKTGISSHTGKLQRNVSLVRRRLRATLQCKSLLLMAN